MDDKTNNERGITMLPMSAIEINNGQLEGLPKNPRLIKNGKYDKLKESITNYPEMLSWRSLLVYPLDNGKYIIIGGNMRYRAMEELGHKEAPVFIIPQETPIEKIKAYTILDNNGFGEWDWDLLANEWETFELDDWGVDLPAFDESTDDEDGDEGNVAEDDFDEDKDDVEPRTNKGDIWVLGEHRLMCGDSSNAADVALLMNGEKAQMVFTDPPYGVSIGDKNAILNSVQKAGRCCTNIKNDTLPSDKLYPILVAAMTNCRNNCRDDATYFVTSPQIGELGLMMMMMMKDAGLPVRHMLIWEKNVATFSLGRLDYDYQHEPIFYTWTKSHKNYRKGEFRTTIWRYAKPRKCDLHPTMKPVELVANCMTDGTQGGDIVLDVFGGSGTTLIAAEQKGRKARLMELDPHYCDVIVARWEKLTGKTAQKLSKVRNDTKR